MIKNKKNIFIIGILLGSIVLVLVIYSFLMTRGDNEFELFIKENPKSIEYSDETNQFLTVFKDKKCLIYLTDSKQAVYLEKFDLSNNFCPKAIRSKNNILYKPSEDQIDQTQYSYTTFPESPNVYYYSIVYKQTSKIFQAEELHEEPDTVVLAENMDQAIIITEKKVYIYNLGKKPQLIDQIELSKPFHKDILLKKDYDYSPKTISTYEKLFKVGIVEIKNNVIEIKLFQDFVFEDKYQYTITINKESHEWTENLVREINNYEK